MKNLTILIKPASSLCNMRCTYCFYADVSNLRAVKSYGIMTKETTERMIDNVFKNMHADDEITFAFQGGEPTMAGLDYFRYFVETVEAWHRPVPYHFVIQTNGLLLDDTWCAFLVEKKFLVGLSIDGDQTFHDAYRRDRQGNGTFTRVLETKRRLDRFHAEYNILSVLTAQMAQSPKKVWKFIKSNGIRYIQFVPCLDDLSGKKQHRTALSPQLFASFYTTLFSLWKHDLEQGKYISIKFFDDLFNLLVRHLVSACGFTGSCQPQLVVEADGSVYPCDFYVLDKWRTGNITEDSVTELLSAAPAQSFIARKRTDSALCRSCPYHPLCGGGCPRMKHEMYLTGRGKYCGYRDFLETNAKEIKKVAQMLSVGN
jgi:uncharacterized protein